MGTSTDGQICFGFAIDEDADLPWITDTDNDVEGWWRTVNGYEPPFTLYDERGEYLHGKRPPKAQLDAYYEHQRAWDAEHPLPVEVVTHCSADCTMYIIAVRGTLLEASRGSPKSFDPEALRVSPSDVAALRAFCEQHGIETGDHPRWWLSSMWM